MGDTVSAIVSTPRRTRGVPALHIGLAAEAPTTPAARYGLASIDRIEIARGAKRRVQRIDADEHRLEIALADPHLSSQHARISRLGRDWVLEDLGSKNGTFVNGKRIARQPLASGDAILVGHTVLLFRDRGGDAGDLAAPAPATPGFATMSPLLA